MPNEQLLRRYADAQVNLTTLRLVHSHLPDNEFTASHFSKREYAAVYDSLLALYHAVKIHYRANRSCIWVGKEDMDSVLGKVRSGSMPSLRNTLHNTLHTRKSLHQA